MDIHGTSCLPFCQPYSVTVVVQLAADVAKLVSNILTELNSTATEQESVQHDLQGITYYEREMASFEFLPPPPAEGLGEVRFAVHTPLAAVQPRGSCLYS